MTGEWDPRPEIFARGIDVSATEIVNLLQTGALDIDLGFQRGDSWTKSEQSTLIESLALRLPIPSLLFCEESDGRLSVIDGKQRVTAIDRYMRDEFTLDKLYFAQELSGLLYSELPISAQIYLKRGRFHVNVLDQNTPDRIKRELFLRTNLNGRSLSPQDVRNARFGGPLLTAARSLAAEPFFMRQMRGVDGRPSSSLRGTECVLRFLVLSAGDVILRKDLSGAVDDFLEMNHDASASRIDTFAKKFRRSLEGCESLWGEKAFRRFERGKWGRNFTSQVFESQMLACDDASDEETAAASNNRDGLLTATEELFINTKNSMLSRLTSSSLMRARRDAERMLEVIRIAASSQNI